MSFAIVILCADSYTIHAIRSLSAKYFNAGKLDYYFLLRSALWLKLFKERDNADIGCWIHAVYLFRRANYYNRKEV